MTQRRCKEVGGSRNSRCTPYLKTTDGGYAVTMMERCGVYGRIGIYLSARAGSPAVEDTTNVKRGDRRKDNQKLYKYWKFGM